MADGSRVKRKFERSIKLRVVYQWLQTLGVDINQYKLATTLPKVDYDKMDVSLEELKLVPSALLTLMSK